MTDVNEYKIYFQTDTLCADIFLDGTEENKSPFHIMSSQPHEIYVYIYICIYIYIYIYIYI